MVVTIPSNTKTWGQVYTKSTKVILPKATGTTASIGVTLVNPATYSNSPIYFSDAIIGKKTVNPTVPLLFTTPNVQYPNYIKGAAKTLFTPTIDYTAAQNSADIQIAQNDKLLQQQSTANNNNNNTPDWVADIKKFFTDKFNSLPQGTTGIPPLDAWNYLNPSGGGSGTSSNDTSTSPSVWEKVAVIGAIALVVAALGSKTIDKIL
jgi:hypothetical protein